MTKFEKVYVLHLCFENSDSTNNKTTKFWKSVVHFENIQLFVCGIVCDRVNFNDYMQ
jgi:hypothetical protein